MPGGDIYAHIRAEFVSGDKTLAELAREHKVSYGSLRQAASRQKWQQQRNTAVKKVTAALQDVTQRAYEDVAVRAADQLAKKHEQALKMAELLHAEMLRHVREAREQGKTLSASDVRAFATSVSELLRVNRLVLGVSTESLEVTGKDGAPFRDPWTPEQLREFARQVNEMV